MHDYFYCLFQNQLRQLTYFMPSRNLSERYDLKNVPFFGGPDWNNAKEDLSGIPENDRPRFILSLFMVVITDQAILTYNRQFYNQWREETRFPKFGCFGFGIHNENPFKLLSTPESQDLVNVQNVIDLMPEFVDFFIGESTKVLIGEGRLQSLDSHFQGIMTDQAYDASRGNIVTDFMAELRKRFPYLGG